MVTDKDREELKELTKQIRKSDQCVQWFDYGWNECAEIITQYVNKKCAESAEQARKESATFEEIKDFLISKSGIYKSEYIQSAIIMLRDCFGSRAAILSPLQNVGNSEQVPAERYKLEIAVQALTEIADGKGLVNNTSSCYMDRAAPKIPKLFSFGDMQDKAREALKEIQA